MRMSRFGVFTTVAAFVSFVFLISMVSGMASRLTNRELAQALVNMMRARESRLERNENTEYDYREDARLLASRELSRFIGIGPRAHVSFQSQVDMVAEIVGLKSGLVGAQAVESGFPTSAQVQEISTAGKTVLSEGERVSKVRVALPWNVVEGLNRIPVEKPASGV